MINHENIVLANLMKRIRFDEKVSTIELSKKLHVTQQYISEMEKGRKAINPAVFDDLLRTYNIKFEKINERHVHNMVYDVVAAFLYDGSNLKKAISKILDNKEIKYSILYPTYLLAEFLYLLLFDNGYKDKFLVEQINTLFDVYAPTEKLLYYAVLINFKLQNDDVDISEMKRISRECDEVILVADNELQYGLFATINYSIIYIYESERNIFNIIKYCNIASSYFKKALMIQGFVYSKIYYVGNMIAVGNFDEAEEILDIVNILSNNLELNNCLNAINYQRLLLYLAKDDVTNLDKYLNIVNIKKTPIKNKLIISLYYILNKKITKGHSMLKEINNQEISTVDKDISQILSRACDDISNIFELITIMNGKNDHLLTYEKIIYLTLLANYCKNEKISEYENIMNLRNRFFTSY